MSATINDGGPAFPQPIATAQDGAMYCSIEKSADLGGMSLRDKFAETCPLTPESFAPVYGMELDEILRHPDHAKVFWALFADERYAYADAMLAARGKGAA